MDEQQLGHERKLKKREAIRRQFASSVSRVNALKGEESGVGEASEHHPKKRVQKLLKDQPAAIDKPPTANSRSAYPKGEDPFGTGCSKQAKA